MKPTRHDVLALATSLMTVVSGIHRASHKGEAATLSILGAVAARRRVRPSEIALRLAVNQSSVTRQIQKLERLGFVRLQPDPSDGRSCHIVLKAAGRSEMRRLTAIGLNHLALFVHDWEASDVRTLACLLENFERSKSTEAGKRRSPPRWRAHAEKR